jgi:hypothetical protein
MKRFWALSAEVSPPRQAVACVSYDFLCYTPAEFEALRTEPTIVKDAVEHGLTLVLVSHVKAPAFSLHQLSASAASSRALFHPDFTPVSPRFLNLRG